MRNTSPMDYAAPAGTAPARTDARPSCAEAARIVVWLYSQGAIEVQISLFPGVDGSYNMTVTFPEGMAFGQQGGQPRPQAQPRPRGAQAENWRRRDPAADPGPKNKPRRRKANVQSSTQCPPAAEPVALAPGHQEGGSNSELKRRSRSATRTAHQHLKMAEVAAKTQVAGAPEAPAPTTPTTPSCPHLVEAKLVEKQEEKDVAALAAAERMRNFVYSMLEEMQIKGQEILRKERSAMAAALEAKRQGQAALAGALAAKTQGAAAPATPPRALVATPCPPSLGKRGPSPSRSSPSPGSSGGRPPPQIDADGFQLVVGRTGKERSGGKVPKKARARERERDGSL